MATPKRPRRLLLGGVIGLLAGTAAVAASEAVSALVNGTTSPLLAVGNRAIFFTPRPLKEFAIRTFGDNDKPVLIGGVVATVALLAVVAGVIGVRRPRLALGAFLALSLVAAIAAMTDQSATANPVLQLLPVLALVVVGSGALLLLLRTLRIPARSTADDGSRGATTAPTGGEGSAAPAPDQKKLHASHEGGKARLLVGTGDLLPAHVEGDDLPAAFDRRAFLATAGAVSAVVVAGGAVRQTLGGSAAAGQRADLTLPQAASKAPALPAGAQLDVKGITSHLTSNKEFYRVDTALKVPDVPIEGYTLRIHGMVDKEIELSFEDLLKRRMVERRITLTCVSNPVGGPYAGNATWLGIPIRDLLEEAGVKDGADAVKSTSADDMAIGTPLAALNDPKRDSLIAVGMNGEPLPLAHGFPVRMVVPGLYGYVSATKWLVDLEVTRFADFKAYWSTRGYSVKAPIKTSSRIDVPKSFAQLKTGKVPIAGVAWSQDRGIKKVEVRVDSGPWQEAKLADEDNINTWRQWVYMWDAKPGNHQIEVRATDEHRHTCRRPSARPSPRTARPAGTASTSPPAEPPQKNKQKNFRRRTHPGRPQHRTPCDTRPKAGQARQPTPRREGHNAHHQEDDRRRGRRFRPQPHRCLWRLRQLERHGQQRHRQQRGAVERAGRPRELQRRRRPGCRPGRPGLRRLRQGRPGRLRLRGRHGRGPGRDRREQQPAAQDAGGHGLRQVQPEGQPGRHAQRWRVHRLRAGRLRLREAAQEDPEDAGHPGRRRDPARPC